MRWKVEPRPSIGDIRFVNKFAWLPKRLKNDTVVWLERYLTTETYTVVWGSYLPYCDWIEE